MNVTRVAVKESTIRGKGYGGDIIIVREVADPFFGNSSEEVNMTISSNHRY